MADLKEIEDKAELYAEARKDLREEVEELETKLAEIRRTFMPRIREAVKMAQSTRDDLCALVELNPQLFEKPRTRTLHGIKVGWAKGKGKIEIEDEAQVVRLIRKHMADRFEDLVKVSEKPLKSALNQLTTAELKKIGVTVEETGDAVVVKPTDSEVDKIVEALLKDDPEEEERKAS